MITQKMIDRAKNNIMVHIVFNVNKKACECVGAIVKISDTEVRVSFNTIDDMVRDSITIQRTDILSIEKAKKIKIFQPV